MENKPTNAELAAQLTSVADALAARGTSDLSYHELQAYNDAHMGAQNLTWADEKRAEIEAAAKKVS